MTGTTTINSSISGTFTLSNLYTTITQQGSVVGDYGVVGTSASGIAWTVANAGVILGGTTGFDFGIYLGSDGAVYNKATGRISGDYGILIEGLGTVTNQGSIAGSAGYGIYLGNGGMVTNDAGAYITGSRQGVYIKRGAGTVTNSGTISSPAYALKFSSGGAVTNMSGAVITGGTTGILSGLGTVTNSGTISSAFGFGIYLTAGGSVDNMSSGTITSRDKAIYMNGAGTVTNVGTIEGLESNAIALVAGGSVTNAVGGMITASNYGVVITNSPGTLTNSGSIIGYTGVGIAGGNITNTASGLIEGSGGASSGVMVSGIATVTNAGTLIGGSSALYFLGATSNRLIVDPGAVFIGGVDGNPSKPSANTLELASGSSVGTLTGIGANYTNFAYVIVDADARWSVPGASGTGTISIAAGADLELDGSVTSTQPVTFLANTGTLGIGNSSGFGATVYGLQGGDVIDFTTLTATGSVTAAVNPSHQLTVSQGSSLLASVQLDPLQDFSAATFDASISGGGVVVTDTTPCFCAGTLIRTVRGDVAVESLAEGDVVVTASGKHRPIRWIGRRSYKGYFIRDNRDVLPIRIKAGALADNVPSRDLCVSPLHAMLVGGFLIPAFKLVNGVTIVQVQDVEAVHYFHIELDSHDILLAEDAPTESFVDDDSRDLFHNAPEYWSKHPRQPWRPARFCAPRIEDGYELEDALHPLLIRAGLRDAWSSPYGDPLGELRGWVEDCSPERIAGWAQNMEFPHAGVVLSIFLGDDKLADIIANKQRADLEEAGIGDGRHAFEYRPKTPIPAERLHTVRVVRAMDREALPGQANVFVAA